MQCAFVYGNYFLLFQCLIFLCELMERMTGTAASLSDQFFEAISDETSLLEALVQSCLLDESVLNRLMGLYSTSYVAVVLKIINA